MVSALRSILPRVASCDLLFCMTGFHLLYTPLHPSVRTPELKITFFLESPSSGDAGICIASLCVSCRNLRRTGEVTLGAALTSSYPPKDSIAEPLLGLYQMHISFVINGQQGIPENV